MAVLTKILSGVVTETEVTRMVGVQSHATPSTPVALGDEGLLKVPVWRCEGEVWRRVMWRCEGEV